jgi:hypothetical protein
MARSVPQKIGMPMWVPSERYALVLTESSGICSVGKTMLPVPTVTMFKPIKETSGLTINPRRSVIHHVRENSRNFWPVSRGSWAFASDAVTVREVV